ncbi:TetR/AcrR family transcriptional regulator [Paraburkholderia sp. D15]|uniref:TetR/AcrR family transcriptional regulator n=1 Tax=Paraburkholderia sp. D15 TaxID=2880218 RepID=UPI0024793783|nr:TetR/AcrR family transcriptional regulator [Paraburkholderia sp. D15]WGS51351.1 TetR/AcrR family transcriptional regulator [Paraburkholderia sp. D15]
MPTTLNSGARPGRGRPRAFDPDAALEVGQRLFHASGYDGVGLSALTEALGIKPPSFYMAFGSKAAFFERVLERYAQTEIPLGDVLRAGRAPAEALGELLVRAARTYARDPERPGCLVLEAARGHGDSESALLARRTAEGRRAQVKTFVAATHPKVAGVVTDLVSTVMSGLSANAREGMGEARLVKVARAAAAGIEGILR